jgi:hypothetical protein
MQVAVVSALVEIATEGEEADVSNWMGLAATESFLEGFTQWGLDIDAEVRVRLTQMLERTIEEFKGAT